jgi:hypothetical protein
MPAPDGIWRRAFTRALFIATSLTATPATACPTLTVDELARQLPGVDRFDFGTELLPPFLALWLERSVDALPETPDGVTLFAPHGLPLLIAFGQAGCLMALLPTSPAALWQAMREHIGPVA